MKQNEEKIAQEARLQIEDDGLAILTSDGRFHLPKEAVDSLVVSLLVSGFGPQQPAEYNAVLVYRDMRLEKGEQPS